MRYIETSIYLINNYLLSYFSLNYIISKRKNIFFDFTGSFGEKLF